MLFGKNLMPDGRPTMSEWPVRVWAEKELKEEFRIQARKWIRGSLKNIGLYMRLNGRRRKILMIMFLDMARRRFCF